MDACSRARQCLSTGLLTLGPLAAACGFVSPAGASAAAAGEELMLVNVRTGKCLTIAGGVSTDNNVRAVQFDCDSDPARRWTLTPGSGADVYQVRNVQTGKCLTIAGGVSTENNVTALQFDCDSHPSRTWRIVDVTGGASIQLTG